MKWVYSSNNFLTDCLTLLVSDPVWLIAYLTIIIVAASNKDMLDETKLFVLITIAVIAMPKTMAGWFVKSSSL